MAEKMKNLIKNEEDEKNKEPVEEYQKSLEPKFEEIQKEIEEMPKNIELFRNHQLPLARIKKIMKSDEDVRVLLQLLR